MTKVLVMSLVVTLIAPSAWAINPRSLDGTGNNIATPDWGTAGSSYTRVAEYRYGDGVSSMISDPLLPSSRYISNRIFNDRFVNIFDENNVTQFGFQWGQFMDHTFGRAEGGGSAANISFDALDPLESFTNDFGMIPFHRNVEAAGTGTDNSNPREHVNTVSSYIDGWSVYGGTDARLEWLREGPVDGDLSNNGAKLLVRTVGSKDYLPRATDRGDATGATAPEMETDGRLTGIPEHRVVAGDVRANENVALTSLHTLFLREHNRIVDLLPSDVGLTEEDKFQIARKIVGAEQQAITYNEFLPALGIQLPAYAGYNNTVNANLTTEFATVGYRAHSMIHGEFEIEIDTDEFTQTELDAFNAQGITVEFEGDEVELAVPLNVAYFNPDLVEDLGIENILKGLGGESQYKNDEQIDNQLRSLLFQVPNPGFDPNRLDGPNSIQYFSGVVDLAAIDIERGRDHGISSYNDLREAYGLQQATSFTEITGESTETLSVGVSIDDPAVLNFVSLPGNEEALTDVPRVETIAARLAAIYSDVDDVDPFVGMISEPHLPGKSFGALQNAVWEAEFLALRDGDRFYYENDTDIAEIESLYGVYVLSSLKDIIVLNTELTAGDLRDNVFLSVPEPSTYASFVIGGLLAAILRLKRRP